MVDESGVVVSWPQLTQRLRMTADVPALVLGGSWANRPPMAQPWHGTFQLVHLASNQWLLEQPVGTPRLVGDGKIQATIDGSDVRTHIGDGWLQEPAGMVAAPISWFPNPAETEALELPGRERVAGRSCRRLLVTYSQHSTHQMMLWLDDEWPLVLAARSHDRKQDTPARFELRITEVRRATDSQVSRYTRWATETIPVGAHN